ncbi:hypothetical protein AB0F52_45770 [Amycolatopsis sp. NPDC024027]|uniref:hypothetical protein n=1 Tax=Amycolatopsis sp. NPDC024027 TaxID=3154327 RepID=UPI0033E961EA
MTHRCEPRPAALPDLPTDADAMLAYLHKSTYGEGDTRHDLGNEVVALAEGYLRPAARAALYEAVAKVPGLVARPDAEGADGRPVLGITWNSTAEYGIGHQDEFLFDPVTFAYLGSGTTGVVDAVAPAALNARRAAPGIPERPFERGTQPKKTSASW